MCCTTLKQLYCARMKALPSEDEEQQSGWPLITSAARACPASSGAAFTSGCREGHGRWRVRTLSQGDGHNARSANKRWMSPAQHRADRVGHCKYEAVKTTGGRVERRYSRRIWRREVCLAVRVHGPCPALDHPAVPPVGSAPGCLTERRALGKAEAF